MKTKKLSPSSKRKCAVVLVTAPDSDTAHGLANAALGARLAACVNVLPAVESFFWWEGKIDTAAEVLLVFKTTHARLAALEKLILEQHPYDTPEFLVLAVERGNQRYLDWIQRVAAEGKA
jgi:periplasmic divalent cation tolerance protein